MIKIIPNKKDIGAEIECDLNKILKQDLKKIKTIKFQGKTVKIFPLINSVKPNSKENKKKALITFLNLIK